MGFVMIVVSAILTYGVMWWNTPVTNEETGKTTTKGRQVQKFVEVLINPEQSLDIAFEEITRLNVLLIGLDHVPPTPKDPGKIRRCDSIIVASTDFTTHQIRLLSIPRDGWAPHWQGGKLFGYERLAHTFSLGQQYNVRHKLVRSDILAGGIERSKESIEHLLGLKLDYYVVIQFEGMVELVDTICPNGLEIEVEKDMKYSDKAGGLYIDLKKGTQRLGGEELLGYARFRKDATGDIGRMARQQKVLRLLLQEMMKKENLSKLPKVAKLLEKNVRTDLSISQLVALAQNLDNYSTESIQTKTLMSWYNLERGKERDIPGLTVAEAREGGYHVQGLFQKDIDEGISFLDSLEVPPPPEEPETEAVGSSTGVADPG